MSTTQYLGLNKPSGSDLVNPLTDTFPNWDIVDNAYHGLDIRSIGRATELVSQGVHAITLLDADCKTFIFVATANYTAGETFTINGIQCNAYTPSGTALTTNAFISGAVVLCSLNADGTVITFYVSGSAVADDSLKLGGELPSYYAKQTDVNNIGTDVTNLKNQAGNTSLAGIGDGTTSGAVITVNNNLVNLKSQLNGLIVMHTDSGSSTYNFVGGQGATIELDVDIDSIDSFSMQADFPYYNAGLTQYTLVDSNTVRVRIFNMSGTEITGNVNASWTIKGLGTLVIN